MPDNNKFPIKKLTQKDVLNVVTGRRNDVAGIERPWRAKLSERQKKFMAAEPTRERCFSCDLSQSTDCQ